MPVRPDATFDAAYLVTVLGEIPDPQAALCELRRVLKPTGRLVVGEFLDRHYVPVVNLLSYGNAAGLELSGRLGPPLAYFARLRPDRCAGRKRLGSAAGCERGCGARSQRRIL